MSMFSQMSTRSGTITVIGRKSALSPSGSSERPRYPGFIVMKAPQVGSSEISSDSMTMRADSALTPSHTDLNCTVHTDSTSGMRRLNSSKQPHEPDDARPCADR